MPKMKLVVAGAAVGATAGVVTSGIMFALGQRFINEFTRPGVVLDPDAPMWGGWKFPRDNAEPPAELQRVVAFRSADGTLLRGEFWAQPQPAPTVIISHGFHLPSVNFRSVAALEYAYGVN